MVRKKEILYRNEVFTGEPVKMTSQTRDKLLAELETLIENIKKKTEDLGATQDSAQDWHDNAAYDHLLQELDVLESRQMRYQAALNNLEIINPRNEIDTVQLGNTVVIQFLGEFENETFTILGPYDGNTNSSWISVDSPVGNALIGQKAGAVIKLPNGAVVKLLKILPGDF